MRAVSLPNRSAFTLVELLVVVSIIALLISILLPSLNKARESARVVKCMSNMRQIGQADSIYLTEYSMHLPWTTPTNTYNHRSGATSDFKGVLLWNENDVMRETMGKATGKWWFRGYEPGVLCPNAEWAQSKENIRNSGAVIRRSYGSSTHGTGGGWGQKGEKVLTRYPDEVVGPASKVHFGEGLSWVVNRWHADLSGRNYFELGEFPPDWGWGTRGGVTAYRHHTDFAQQKGNTNQLMFDGHVRTVNREDIMWRWQWEPLWD